MADTRLPTHLEVGGLIRAVQAAGGFATVIARGERDAGTLMLVLSERGPPAVPTPNASPKRSMNRGQSRPNSKERTVPVTAPTAKRTATAFDQRRARSSASASSRRSFSPDRMRSRALSASSRWSPATGRSNSLSLRVDNS